MAFIPISGIVPQATENGNQANGMVLKFYENGTLTPLEVGIDSTGVTKTTEFVLSTEGYTTLSGNEVIPHVDQVYKVVLYLDQTDADADATGSAVYVIDGIDVGLFEASNLLSYNSLLGANGALASSSGSVGDIVQTAEYIVGSQVGGGRYIIASPNPGNNLVNPQKTDGSGFYLKLLIDSNELSPFLAGAVGDGSADDTAQAQDVADYLASKSGNPVFISLDSGVTFLITSLTMPVSVGATGYGTIKKSGALTLFNHTLGVIGARYENINIDMNSAQSDIWSNGNLGSTDFTLHGVTCKNLDNQVYDFTGAFENKNVSISNCTFRNVDSGGVQSSGDIFSVFGLRYENNYTEGMNSFSATNSATFSPDNVRGKIVVTGNVIINRPNILADSSLLSLLLIRSNDEGSFTNDIIVSNNFFRGGKAAVTVGDPANDNPLSRVVVSNNIMINNSQIGMVIGSSGTPAADTLENIVVSNNIITQEDDVMSGNGLVSGGMIISTAEATITGNIVSNKGLFGIQVVDCKATILGNTVFNCVRDSVENAGVAATGAIQMTDSSDCNISENTVYNNGFLASLWTAGIAFRNGDDDGNKVTNNIIYDDQVVKTQAFCIRLSRSSGAPHPANTLVSGNVLGDQALTAESKIWVRSATENNYDIYDNRGWGNYRQPFAPGTVAALATVITATVTPDAEVGDIVEVSFAGQYEDPGIANPNLWITSGYVLNAGTITIYISNLSASSDDFTEANDLTITLKRLNAAV